MSVTTAERHLQTFLTTVPSTGIAEVRQISITPLWIETAYAKNIVSHPDGRIHIAEARLTLVSWLFFARVKVKDFQQPPLPYQRDRAPYPRDSLNVK